MKQKLSGFFLAIFAMGAIFTVTYPAMAQELGKLYAARPPEGSAFARIVSGLDTPAIIKLGSLDTVTLDRDGNHATDFRVLKGGQRNKLEVNGAVIADTLDILPNSFVTILLSEADRQIKAKVITDSTRGHDDLKAELRAYNLIHNCNGQIAIAGGPAVFNDLVTGETMQRAINPVSADLEGKCISNDSVGSSALKLPQLKAGDRYSLFLIGSLDQPVLKGQIDQTTASE